MTNDWVKVYSTKVAHLCQIAQGVLDSENIKSFVINKTDSSYVQLFDGEMEVFVQPQDVIRAKYLIEQNEL